MQVNFEETANISGIQGKMAYDTSQVWSKMNIWEVENRVLEVNQE